MSDNKKYLGYFSIILFVAVLFIVGILLGRDKKGFLDLPKTGEKPEPNIYIEAKNDLEFQINSYLNKGEINPWVQDQPKKGELPLPSIEELFNIYSKISEAYSIRDLSLFKEYASTERIFHVYNPKTNAKADYKGVSVFLLLGGISPEENFINNSLLLCHVKAPQLNLLNPSQVAWDERQFQLGEAYLLNEEKKEYSIFKGDNWINRVNLILEVVPNEYVKGFGTISFVYDNGVWKYHFEEWDLDYTPVELVGEVGSYQNLIELDYVTPESLTINENTLVQWPNINGYILTKMGSTEHWNSGYIKNSAFVKGFNNKGVYKYTILNKTFEEIFNGEIIVN